MSDVTFGSIKNWKLLPLLVIRFVFDSATYQFENLEASSEVNFDLVTDENDRGGVSPVAVSMSGKIILIQDNFTDMLPFFKSVKNEKCRNIWLYAGMGSSTPGGAAPPGSGIMKLNREKITIGSPPVEPIILNLEDYNITYNIKFLSISPKLTISFTGILSLDIFDEVSPNRIFEQFWTKVT